MIHKLAIELDIPDGMESAVSDAAHHAIRLLNEHAQRQINEWHRTANVIQGFMPDERAEAVQRVIDDLRNLATRERQATEIVTMAYSELSHMMSEADSQWRVRQGKQL